LDAWRWREAGWTYRTLGLPAASQPAGGPLATLAALSGCGSSAPRAGVTPTRPIPTPLSAASASRSSTAGTSTSATLFRVVDGVELPNPALTPGQANRDVTTAQVCGQGLPSAGHPSYGTRKAVMVGYGLITDASHAYTVVRLIPSSLGGITNEKNLFPVRRAGTGNATQKQALDARLLARVCAGQLTLAAAERLLRQNWWAAHRSMR
jgi:hypothetical protein